MNFCIYSPYIPKHFGGGEKYLFTVAQVLATKGNVDIAIPRTEQISQDNNKRLKSKYSKFIGEKLSDNINFVASPLGTKASFFKKLFWTFRYDVMYYATDGSLFFSLAKRNILHIQVPFNHGLSLMARLKLSNWSVKNTNSEFTKGIIEKSWKTKVNFVHHPVIVENVEKVQDSEKEHVILNVGRFFRQLHSKRQDILVEAFRSLLAKNEFLSKAYKTKLGKKAERWRLVLIGTVEDEAYFKKVKKIAKDLPVEILDHVTREELLDWYKRASIYWHATGYEIDELDEPEKVEHFGISVVEAMSYGCVPLITKKGGHKEILQGSLEKWLWESRGDLATKTLHLIEDTTLLKTEREKARSRAKFFDRDHFESTLWKMIYD